jgi:hypothetical protein
MLCQQLTSLPSLESLTSVSIEMKHFFRWADRSSNYAGIIEITGNSGIKIPLFMGGRPIELPPVDISDT